MEDIIRNIDHYLPAAHPQICILDMDITEPEILVRKIAEACAEKHPEYFNCDTSYVFYRLRYMPPYEKFEELRNLIVRISQATGLRSEYHGFICVDPSEYKGHEEEEYFTAVLKYLFDHGANCMVMLVCCQYTEQEMGILANTCMKTLKTFSISKERIHLFDHENLCKLINASFRENKVPIDSSTAHLIAETLLSPELESYRSLQLIEALPREIQCGGTDVETYFKNPDSPLCMMAGHPLVTRKNDYEHTI